MPRPLAARPLVVLSACCWAAASACSINSPLAGRADPDDYAGQLPVDDEQDPAGATDDPNDRTDSDLPDNQAPTVDDLEVELSEDQSALFRLVARDPNGQALTWRITQPPEHGTTTGAPPQLRYVPDPHYAGADTLRFEVSDGRLSSGEGVVRFTVLGVPDAPVANPVHVTTDEDTPITFALSAHDPDGDPIASYAIPNMGPTHGVATLHGALVTYTPAPDHDGRETFEFLARGPDGLQGLNTVTIDLTPVNDAPWVTEQTFTTLEDTSLVFTPTVLDVDDTEHSFTVLTQPTHGAASSSGGSLLYLPHPDHHGADSFTYLVSDPSGATAVGAALLFVAPVNDAPTIDLPDQQTDEDSPLTLTITAEDLDGDPLTLELWTDDPAHGEVRAQPDGTWLYSPPPDAHGAFPLHATATDASQHSVLRTATITVLPVEDPPRLLTTALTLDEDAPLSFDLLAADVDTPNAQLHWRLVRGPQRGQLHGALPAGLLYTPWPDLHGADSLIVELRDGVSPAVTRTVTLDVQPVNDPPRLVVNGAVTQEDTPVTLDLGLHDPEADPITVRCASPCEGRIAQDEAGVWLLPLADEHGTLELPLVACDAHGACSPPATLTAVVAPVNDPPVARHATWTVQEDGTLSQPLDATDADADPLSFTILRLPTQGTLTVQGGLATYTPAPNFSGADSFQFQARDGQLSSAAATVQIVVSPLNDPPVLNAQTWRPDEDSPGFRFRVPATDPDGDPLTLTISAAPTHGELTLDGAFATYVPHPDYHGPDSATFTATDGVAPPVSAIQTFAVQPVADPPTVPPSTFRTAGNTSLVVPAAAGLLRAAYDVDGPDTIEALAATLPSALGGTVQVRMDGGFTYTPPLGLGERDDQFVFQAQDGGQNVGSYTATVQLGRVVWVVDNRSTGGDGRPHSPLSSLSAAQAASAPGDLIAVHPGDGSSRGHQGITLQPGQTLRGLETDLVLDGQTVASGAGARPVISSTSGPAVTGAADTRIEHLRIVNPAGVGVALTEAHRAVVQQCAIAGSAGDGVQVLGSDEVVVENVNVQAALGDGISIAQSEAPSVRLSTVTDCVGHGVALHEVHGSTELFTNTFWQNHGDGVWVEHLTLHTALDLQLVGNRVYGGGLTDRGVHLLLAGEGTFDLELRGTLVEQAAVEGVRVQLAGDLLATATLDSNSVTRSLGPAYAVQLDDTAQLDLDSEGSVASHSAGAPRGWTLLGRDHALLTALLRAPTVSGAADALTLTAEDSAHCELTLLTPSLTAGVRAMQVVRSAEASATLTTRDGTLQAPIALNAHAGSAASQGRLDLELTDNTASGVWTLTAPQSQAGGPYLALASAVDVGQIGENTDRGALASLGNTTAGGPAVVSQAGAAVLIATTP